MEREGGSQTDPPPPEKSNLKKPSLPALLGLRQTFTISAAHIYKNNKNLKTKKTTKAVRFLRRC